FDDGGAVADATIVQTRPQVVLHVATIEPCGGGFEFAIASAVPKGERADWMIEKLSELGCSRFVPLAASRSIVLPEGKNKRDRWLRIATESAKQSRRIGVMQIDDLTDVETFIASHPTAFVLDPTGDPIDIHAQTIALLIGPEG